MVLAGSACWTMEATPSDPVGGPGSPAGTESPAGGAVDSAAVAGSTPAIAEVAAPPPAEPTRSPAEPEPEPEPEEDDEDEVWVGPPDHIDDCEGKLSAAGVQYSDSRIPLHKTKSGILCGAEQVVRYERGPGSIAWGGRPKVTCGVGLALAKLEVVVQEEAERHLGRRVKRIVHMGTYNCREMANYPGWVSEHSYGNAIDIKEFVLAGGRTVSVLSDYAKQGTPAKTAKAKFLRAVARRLYDEQIFAVVLTPSFDRAHRNHFHLDMARYRVDGI